MVEQSIGLHCHDIAIMRAECDQNARDIGGGRGFAVGQGVADQDGVIGMASGTANGLAQMLGIGFAHGQAVSAEHGGEIGADAEAREQGFGQSGGLVGANAKWCAAGLEPLKLANNPVIKPGMGVDMRAIIGQKIGVIGRDIDLGIIGFGARKPQSQHGFTAFKRGFLVGNRIKLCAKSGGCETGIGGRDQITAGVGQSAVEIENYTAHDAPF